MLPPVSGVGGVVLMYDVQNGKVFRKTVDIAVLDECRNRAFSRAGDGHAPLHHSATGCQFSDASYSTIMQCM